jgi:hypothetical protein
MASKRWQRGRLAVGVAVVYLTLVVAAFVVFFVDYTFVEHEDASFSGVIPYFATAPLSWIGIMAVPEGSSGVAKAMFLAVPAVCGGLQALGLWLALRGRRLSSGDRPA